MHSLKNNIKMFKAFFLQSNLLGRDVKTNWISFKNELFKQTDKHIPKKKPSS